MCVCLFINTNSRPLKRAVCGSRAVLVSVKPPQACHGMGTAINLTDIIQSDGWGGVKTAFVQVCMWLVLSPAPVPNSRSLQCHPHSINTVDLSPLSVPFFSPSMELGRSSKWYCLLTLAHGSDVRRGNFSGCKWQAPREWFTETQREKRETVSYVRIQQWQLKKKR